MAEFRAALRAPIPAPQPAPKRPPPAGEKPPPEPAREPSPQERWNQTPPEEKYRLAWNEFWKAFSWWNVLKNVLLGLAFIALGVLAVVLAVKGFFVLAATAAVALAVAATVGSWSLCKALFAEVAGRWKTGDYVGAILAALKYAALIAGARSGSDRGGGGGLHGRFRRADHHRAGSDGSVCLRSVFRRDSGLARYRQRRECRYPGRILAIH